MSKFLLVIFLSLILYSSSVSAQGTAGVREKVDSLAGSLDEYNKRSVNKFYKSIFLLDSLAEPALIANMKSENSLEKNSVLSHALVYVSKDNILHELVDFYKKTSGKELRDIVVYSILGVRYKFNQTSNLKLLPDKEIFPILITALTDTLDISSIAEGIKHINGIAWLALQKWGSFQDMKETFSVDFLNYSAEELKSLQQKLLYWWQKNGPDVYWDGVDKVFKTAHR